jgi:hypothetical protein
MLPGEEELFENLEKWKAERPDQAARLEQWIKTVREIDPDYEPHLDTSFLPYDREDLHKKALNIREQKKLAKAKALQDLPMDEASRLARAKAISFVPKTTGEKAVGTALKGLDVLDKGLAHAGKLAIGADVAQGNIPEAVISAAEFAAPKLGATATRVAPFLDLLRPETTQTEEQEQSELEQAKFNKLKQALKKRGLAVE